jgi:hypothetical protein
MSVGGDVSRVSDAGDGDESGSTRRSSATLRLHKLGGENVCSISFAGQYRAVFHLGEQRRPGHAHIVWQFIGSHDEDESEY